MDRMGVTEDEPACHPPHFSEDRPAQRGLSVVRKEYFMKRKRIPAAILALALALTMVLPTAAAQPVTYTLTTDIEARINGHPLRSYNIDGYTAVVAEDLRGYGFQVAWNSVARTLTVERSGIPGGGPLTPVTWPEYVKEPLTKPIGSPAEAILPTDIRTYVAGQLVESYSIDGVTLIRIDDLAPYGTVVWDSAARTISLTLGDPLQIQISRLTAALENWKQSGGPASYCVTYPCQDGTLFTAYWTGISHGKMWQMVYVDRLGNSYDLLSFLPPYGYGTAYYVEPRDIQVSDDGIITFVTPIREALETGEIKEWGDTRCTINPQAGQITYFPLTGSVSSWSVQRHAGEGTQDPNALSITVEKQADVSELVLPNVTFPTSEWSIQASLNQNSISINCSSSYLLNPASQSDGFLKAFNALRELGLPDVSKENFSATNTPAQRAAVLGYFRAELNGQPLTGNLWWGRGNNHIDVNFDFDSPLTLSDGDVLTVWMGMPG